jgi:hypothetical protein
MSKDMGFFTSKCPANRKMFDSPTWHYISKMELDFLRLAISDLIPRLGRLIVLI